MCSRIASCKGTSYGHWSYIQGAEVVDGNFRAPERMDPGAEVIEDSSSPNNNIDSSEVVELGIASR